MAGYLALLGWVLVGADKRFLRRIGVDIYDALRDAVPAGVRPVHYELLLYALLFVPLGWLLLRLTGRPTAWVAVGCVWIVVMIECAQIAFLDRRGSAVEVLVGSLGAILGTVVAQSGSVSGRDRARVPRGAG